LCWSTLVKHCNELPTLRLQVLELLADHLRQWATCIAFPEAAHLPCVALRGFIKGCAVERFRRSAKQLVDALERNIVYVGAARDGVSFAPQDLAAAGRFMADDRDKAKVGGWGAACMDWP
jgi:nucleolar complex protein 2